MKTKIQVSYKYLQITVNVARYAFISDVREYKRQQYHDTRES